jgi:hypothetical protein
MPRVRNDITICRVSDQGYGTPAGSTRAYDDEPRPAEPRHRSPEELLAWMLEDEEELESYLSWAPTPILRRCLGAGRGVRGNRLARSGFRTWGVSWPLTTPRRPSC